MENFAERLFCDLRNAEIKIEKPEYVVEGAKIGQISSTNGIISSPAKQFTIFGVKAGKDYKYKFSSGVNFTDINEIVQSYTEAYNEFLENIKLLGNNLKFYTLVIPRKAVIEVKAEEFEAVVSRYIKDYLVMTDEVSYRWDVLVSAV